MLILLLHPDGDQQALVGSSTIQGAQRLVAKKTQDPEWHKSQGQVPSEEARDTVFWIVPTGSIQIELRHPEKSRSGKKNTHQKKEDPVDDGADRNDGP